MARSTEWEMQDVLDAVNGEGKFASFEDGEFTGSLGNIHTIAKRLDIRRKTVYGYAKRWVSVGSAIKEQKELRKDLVEDKMFKRIIEGSDVMAIFFAKTQMKDRGYVERQELTGADGGPLQVTGLEQSAKQIWGKDSDSGD